LHRPRRVVHPHPRTGFESLVLGVERVERRLLVCRSLGGDVADLAQASPPGSSTDGIGALRCRRQVAQRHVIDPAAAKMADGLGVGYREHLVG